jgi:hypothetical protein
MQSIDNSRHKARAYLSKKLQKAKKNVVQEAKYLPSKHKALSSNPSTFKRKRIHGTRNVLIKSPMRKCVQ